MFKQSMTNKMLTQPINNKKSLIKEPTINNILTHSMDNNLRESLINDILKQSMVKNILNEPIDDDLKELRINDIFKKSLFNNILKEPINDNLKESLNK